MLQNLLTCGIQPFRATPDTRFYYEHPSIESARQTILRAVIRAEGPVAVLGGSGYGKSLLAELVADQLCQRLDIVMLQSARLSSRRALLQSILFELKLPYLDMSEGELRLSILDRLEPSPETAPEGLLILVDEAHTLHWKLLDELRLMSNFTRNHQPRVKLVLFGNLRLEETLASPQLDSFNQRLAARCYLQPMTRSETSNYIRHQLQECGVEPASVITSEALNSVYSASEGIPRLVNQLMDHALWLASSSAQIPVSAALINDAWSDLQQLPTPWSSGKNEQAGTASTIEFGHLPEDDDDQEELGFAPDPQAAPSIPQSVLPKSNSIFSENPQVATSIMPPTALPLDSTANDAAYLASRKVVSEKVLEEKQAASANFEYDLSEQEGSFFAAFHPTASCQFLNSMDDGSEDDKWRVEAEPSRRIELEINLSSPVEPLSDNRNDALIPLSPLATQDFNWFVPQPTSVAEPQAEMNDSDQERIEGLMAEQQQYDALGVWENDPPLSKKAWAAPTVQKALNMDSLDGLFGSDFDDETIVSLDSPAKAVRGTATGQASKTESLAQAESSPDYLARLEQYTDALANAARISAQARKQDIDSVEPVGNSSEDALLADSLWSISVGPTEPSIPLEKPLEEAMEEMVSRLNFSAFSVEPFSMEQISLEASKQSAPLDSLRMSSNDEVYLMHRPLDSTFLPVDGPLDDDRDLLVVEEEIPISLRTLDTRTNDQPIQKTASYNQLFARLRK